MYERNVDVGVSLDQLNIYFILFADDAAICSETAKGLHNSMNQFELFYITWGSTANLEKTKIVISAISYVGLYYINDLHLACFFNINT